MNLSFGETVNACSVTYEFVKNFKIPRNFYSDKSFYIESVKCVKNS